MKKSQKIILLGLDASGKTTLLYRMKNRSDEVVTTIPTIGFNVEVLEMNRVNFTCWDVGGCDKIRPLWRHYFQDATAVVFVVDSNDHERLEYAKDELTTILRDVPASLPLLVVNNKIDLPRSMTMEKVLHGLGLHEVMDRRWEIIPCCAVKPELSKDCLSWIQAFLEENDGFRKDRSHPGITSDTFFSQKKQTSSQTKKPDEVLFPITGSLPDKGEGGTTENAVVQQVQLHNQRKFDGIWTDWIERASKISKASEDEEEQKFIQQFEEFRLPSWDHYSHVLIAYLLIKRDGRDQGFKRIEEGIRNYIANNQSQTNGKSFHATMTRFWCHLVAYWMARLESRDFSETTSDLRDKSAFYRFLVFVHDEKDPKTDLAQSGLFRQYYSNEAIFRAEAKAAVRPPDLSELPPLQ